ncbi:MAG TPA: aminoacyl--tRNA ligase-related protein, partial [Alphaproteobacteria bacterium]|nr:aminoacyl--tRNA ligase-related protein [Alphaproteobacteria bacterium]
MNSPQAKPQGKAPKNAISPTRAEDYAQWYQQVVKSADMAEMSGVRGCMVIKPWGYGAWELMQRDLDARFKATGHDNCYFPLFIPLSYFQKEADHVEGFAKEMAIVTHHRLKSVDGKLVPDGELEEPLVVRPTSETVIGEAMSKWIKSYRDLPLLLNQWANVVRWEMRPRILLRTAEFLWQEGHTAHETQEDAMRETKLMHKVYQEFVEEALALPVIPGEKPANERFPGAVNSYSIEAMMQDGRALQAGTSHYLGQNFSKSIGIQFQSREGAVEHVHTTSWGVSTRLLGAIIMTHADDDGMRMPPRIAPHQIVIAPIFREDKDRDAVVKYCEALRAELVKQHYAGQPLRVKIDARDISGAEKKWEWIKKGVPLLLEIGPRDVSEGKVCVTRRDGLAQGKRFEPIADFVAAAAVELEAIQKNLYDQALSFQKARTVHNIKTPEEFKAYFAKDADNSFVGGQGFVRAKWSGDLASLK